MIGAFDDSIAKNLENYRKNMQEKVDEMRDDLANK